MLLLKSLLHKIVLLLCLLLAIVIFYIYIDISKSYHINNEIIRINVATQLRFRAYEMGWLAQRLAEREVASMDEETRKYMDTRLKSEIASFDRNLKDLKDGNPEKGLEKLEYKDALTLLEIIYRNWTDNMKPVLVQLSDISNPISEQHARNLLEPFDSRLTEVTQAVDMLVFFLSEDYRHEVMKYQRYRLYILGFFLASAAMIAIYAYRRIIRPVKSLQNAAKEIQKGNYDVRIAVTGRDEIGELAQAFNRMADEIADAIGDVMWHSEDVMALNRALNRFVGMQKEEELYRTVCEHARDLFGLRASWMGLLNEEDRSIRIVAYSGADDEFMSRMKVAWDDTEYGMGSEGTAIKTNSPQIINDLELADASLPAIEGALRQGYRSCMVQPLIWGNCAVIGVMVFYSEQKDHFTANMAELCQIFVNHAASVIENVILLRDLEVMVQERTEKLQDALLLAESANRAKSAFLSNMSHDLRTPLNAIIGFSEAMSQGIYGEIKPDQKEYLEYIYQSGLKLLKLINEIMDLSKLETDSLHLDYIECNIGNIINNALYVFREKANKHRLGITVNVAEDAKILTADETKIKQVLFNLLTDSINATPDNGTILIEVSRLHSACAGVPGLKKSVAVSDEKGLSDEQAWIRVAITDSRVINNGYERERIFDPYNQFDTTLNRKQDNMGLLLSKRFVELHGGRLWAEELTPTSGNRFIFILPRRH